MTPPGIAFEGVGLAFGTRRVVENFNMTLRAGRWTALLGESGIGKSSLLRGLAGLLPPDQLSGRIVPSDGVSLTGRLAYMAQQDLLLPWLSVLENVCLGARLRGGRGAASAAAERARRLIAAVGLVGREGDRPAALSGGMRQRVALARTLMEDRPVVLMDEPFSGLDVLTRLRLQDLAARLLDGRTVLLVTHDPLEAIRLCHDIHLLVGDPPVIGTTLTPEGQPPRPAEAREVTALQGELFALLAGKREAA